MFRCGVLKPETKKLGHLVTACTAVTIDGQAAEGFVDRVGFMTADPTGVLPRKEPVREAIDNALVGVTIVYMTAGVPDTLTLTWRDMQGGVGAIPATVTDPESLTRKSSNVICPEGSVYPWA